MPFAPIDDKGTVLEYEDSGAPQSANYTTVFMVNAFLWHGGVFRRMFPHAQKYNLRLIAIHQREYLGSSPFTEDELALLYSDDPEDQATILREQAHAIAKVMTHVIAQGNLPLPRQSDGAHEGGIVILGRSAGCAHVLALLGNLDSLDKSMYSLLEKYVTTIIIHDGPSVVYGIPEPAGTLHPLKDITLSPETVTDSFVSWTTAWHEPFPSLDAVTPEAIIQRKNLSETSDDPKYKPTRMNAEDMKELACPEVAERMGPLFVHWSVAKENTRRALIDTKGQWKNAKVIVEWADMSFWTAAWAAKTLHDLLAEPVQGGEQRRDVRFVRLENTNCWVHHEEPERMLRLIVEQTR